ncbi:substrate-binding domain-containing protein [Salipiger bermudensis]|uniref:Putative sugar ABC transporter periplasmic sugar-binding protein ABC TRANSPORTER n=1 Tax=Salipiger bermudensis (strain DSM 26914 / JCM 13377 / KCTC 12554 / HTCC2601) TaxID=314265 RepID=Q0FK41_SALBH|nr:substrate-binding domain-containing protein [Salipiger bermudensis]EAU44564.1 putative sugar ABC transporter periplasmic sugar-binding protein ABC TRANSPORTER [Salipiger bermudensis HTCC2601]
MTGFGRKAAFVAGTALVSAHVAGAAMAQDFAYVNDHADIAPLCGEEPLRVALIDGYGGNSWRRTAFAELEDEAGKCDNIGEVTYAEAGGDVQAYNAAINGFVAQGYEIIISYTDFGDAAIPAYRNAQMAGTTMVPYFSDLSGRVGVDYAANPYEDAFSAGRIFGEWVGETLGEGTTVFLGGLAGSASSVTFLDGYKDGLSGYPGIELLDDNFIVTNWNPADAQKAVAGLIAKHDHIDAIASDYGVTSLAAVKAYEAAGLDVPAMAFIATNNEYSCKWTDAKAAGEAWPQLALSGTTADVRFALRAALAARNGIENPEPRALVAFPFANSEEGLDPLCDPAMPPDADLSSSLPIEKMEALFSQ